MRLLRVLPAGETGPADERVVLCHDVRDAARRDRVICRKGVELTYADAAGLAARSGEEVHVLLREPGDLDEDRAAARLAGAMAGPGVRVGPAHQGQVSLTSALRGWLTAGRCLLDRANAEEGVIVFTSEVDRPVDAGEVVGGVKCSPLLLPAQTAENLETARRDTGPALDVLPFPTRQWALLLLDGLGPPIIARAHACLQQALGWYGSQLDPVLTVPSTVAAVAQSFADVLRSPANLILAAGASATDPADVLFDGLRQAGGTVDQIGLPIEPGTACWIGQLQAHPVLGLASCELFGRPGALDLLLPPLLLGEHLDAGLTRQLACGGLVTGGPSRLAPYHRPQSLASPGAGSDRGREK